MIDWRLWFLIGTATVAIRCINPKWARAQAAEDLRLKFPRWASILCLTVTVSVAVAMWPIFLANWITIYLTKATKEKQ